MKNNSNNFTIQTARMQDTLADLQKVTPLDAMEHYIFITNEALFY
jgi:hypothetical protein